MLNCIVIVTGFVIIVIFIGMFVFFVGLDGSIAISLFVVRHTVCSTIVIAFTKIKTYVRATMSNSPAGLLIEARPN